MKENLEKTDEKRIPRFEEGQIITCPSDLTGIRWKVTEKKDNGDIIAIVEGGQAYPSEKYPKGTILIAFEAQPLWQEA